jgi:glycosyltransferase involved in cell wall biosynthesis
VITSYVAFDPFRVDLSNESVHAATRCCSFANMQLPEKTIFLIPVHNEEASIEPLLCEIRAVYGAVPVCFVNDCSRDRTCKVLRRNDCFYLDLPNNLGVGGAMQAGFRYAFEQGYQYAIRIDGDGQHPPSECPVLVERMMAGDVDMVVGSRFLGNGCYRSAWYRQAGIFGLAWTLSKVCRRRITDPTSGFQIVNRAVMGYFAHQYPVDYPEPEALALLSRQGYQSCEVGVSFRARREGRSSIRNWGTIYYLFKVGIALFVDRCRAVDPKYDRVRAEEWI